MKKLKSLWMKLEINENDQCTFKENCVGFKPSSIQKVTAASFRGRFCTAYMQLVRKKLE